jgi:lipopolysaccharide transport system ATP-binding protein
MSMPAIEAQNLSKEYRLGVLGAGSLREEASRLWSRLRGRGSQDILSAHHARRVGNRYFALEDVSFSIPVGEVVGIVGKNGAGKSTLLKILSRVTQPSSGEAVLRGKVASLLEVGTGFHPELTGRENIFMSGAVLGMRKKEIARRFDEIVAFSGVEDFIETPVKRYSSGMYVRLAFAVAAHLESDILLVDEVLAVGDAGFQKRCLGKMEDASRQGRTIVFVSHSMSAISSLCTSGLYIEGGRLHPTRNLAECVSLYSSELSRADLQAWEGDLGDEHVRLRSARLSGLTQGGSACYRGERFRLEMSYEVIKPTSLLLIGLELFSRSGNFLLATRLTDESEDVAAAAIGGGVHHVSLELDSGLLADGEYAIKLDFGLNCVKRIIEDEPVLSFAVVDPEKNTAHDVPQRRAIIQPSWSWLHARKDKAENVPSSSPAFARLVS